MSEYNNTNIYGQINIIPDKAEKKRIRKLYNKVGTTLILQYILVYVIVFAAYIFCHNYITEDYNEETGNRIIGFAEASISFCAPAVASIIMFFAYNASNGIRSGKIFKTENVTASFVIKAMLATFLFHEIGMFLEYIVYGVITFCGYDTPDLNYELANDFPTLLINLFSSVILAPIAEEMFFRGVVLKETARVSGRFGIFFSALIFGLMHGNPYQAVMAFMVGLVLGYVTLKSKSIVPSIICHMSMNFLTSISDIAKYFLGGSAENAAYYITALISLISGIIGMIYIRKTTEIKLPPYTEYHKKRTLPIMITSAGIIIALIIYIYDIISGIEPIEEETVEFAETAARAVFWI